MPIFRAGPDLVLFAHVPKCAGQSITEYLSQRFGEPAFSDMTFMDTSDSVRWARTSPAHVPAEALRRLFPSDFFSSSFAFVRDPIARLMSAFYHQRDKKAKIPKDAAFEDWAKILPQILADDPWAFDGHVAPMIQFVPDNAISFKLEDGFAPFITWLDGRYGTSAQTIPRRNAGAEYKEVQRISERTRALIEELYAEDYRRFGYLRQTASQSVTASQRRGEVLLDLGLSRFRRNEPATARRLFNAALEADPRNPVALAVSCVTEAMAGQTEKAESRAEAALEQDPRLLDAQMVRLRGLLDRGLLDKADVALADARRHLGDLPSFDLIAALLAARRGDAELALANCASAISGAIAGGAIVLIEEAKSIWRKLMRDAQLSGDRISQLVDDLGLKPGVAGEPATASEDTILILRLGAAGTEDALPMSPDIVQRILAKLEDRPLSSTVVLVRDRDKFTPDAIERLAKERALTGWGALGTAYLDEPDFADGKQASVTMRQALEGVFSRTAQPTPHPLLIAGAVAFSVAALSDALKRIDFIPIETDDIIPALTLSMTAMGHGVATWGGAIARRAEVGNVILSHAALGRLCAREGALRAILAVDLVASDLWARRLGVALAALALPERAHLLAAMVKRESEDLPVALRASAFVNAWSQDPVTAIEILTALEHGFGSLNFPPFSLPVSSDPVVSIILPAHNHFGATYCTLAALRWQNEAPPFEVILVDDGSSDQTQHIESIVGGLRVLRHSAPRRFIAACNAGSALARGKLLVFLNNDTEPLPGWLAALLDRCRAGAGLAGAKLIFPDGRLQEAGGLLDNTASPSNYGAGDHPLDPRYSYKREADYVSGAALMVSRQTWDKVGGFSTYLEGMYFEDTDLACKVREIGLPVIYEPSALVIHHEGTTSGRDVKSGPKALQEVNRPRFQDRWKDFLQLNPSSDMASDLRADHRVRGRILFVDYSIPRPDNDAGGHASFEEMRMMISAGWKVTFVDAAASYLPGYVEALQQIGVEVLHRPFVSSPMEAVKRLGERVDILYVSRYWLAAELIPILRALNPSARIVANVVDLHFLREMREARSKNDSVALEAARQERRKEIAALSKADLVLTYSTTEIAILWEASDGAIDARLCPWVEEIAAILPSAPSRSGLSFLGGFKHKPNLQGLEWFVSDVLPLLPTTTQLDVYGSGVGPEVEALASAQVRIRGFAPDVSQCFDGYRVFIAPLLAGAGVKGKVIKALCQGLPSVLTPIAAEGLGLIHGVHALIAETPQQWADAIHRLQTDDLLWHTISANALDHAQWQYGHKAGTRIMESLLTGLYAAPSADAPNSHSFESVQKFRSNSPLRLALHFEVQHAGQAAPALWLAELLADRNHSFNLTLDSDISEMANAEMAGSVLAGRFRHFGITRSPCIRRGGSSALLVLLGRLRKSLAMPGWDYFINLSGTSAPLRSLGDLDDYLWAAHDRGIRAHCFVLPLEDGPHLPVQPLIGPVVRGMVGDVELRGAAGLLDWFRDPGRTPILNRENRMFVHVSEPPGERHLLDIRALTDEEFVLRRRLLGVVVPHFGRSCAVLHRSVVESLVAFMDAPRNAEFIAAMLSSVMPEEHFLQTLLANGLIISPEQLERSDLHRDSANPRAYTDADMSSVLAPGTGFFLPHLDPDATQGIRKMLKERLLDG